MDKVKTMVQWMNLLWNKFRKLDAITFLHEKSGAIVLVLPGLMAGWLAVRQAGRQNSTKFKYFKIIYQMKYLLYLTKVRYCYSCTNVFWSNFCIKPTLRWILDMPKFLVLFFWINPYY